MVRFGISFFQMKPLFSGAKALVFVSLVVGFFTHLKNMRSSIGIMQPQGWKFPKNIWVATTFQGLPHRGYNPKSNPPKCPSFIFATKKLRRDFTPCKSPPWRQLWIDLCDDGLESPVGRLVGWLVLGWFGLGWVGLVGWLVVYPIIYEGLAPSRWLALGFLNHQMYHPTFQRFHMTSWWLIFPTHLKNIKKKMVIFPQVAEWKFKKIESTT